MFRLYRSITTMGAKRRCPCSLIRIRYGLIVEICAHLGAKSVGGCLDEMA